MSRWWLRLVGAALAVLGVGVGLSTPAWAHATLVSATPEDGARLDEAPAQVVLEFSDDISPPAYVVVTAPDGTRLATGPAEVDGPVVTQPVSHGSATGAYTVAYRAISVDGHTLTGELGFQVGSGSTSPSATDPTPAVADPTTAPAASAPGTAGSRRGIAVGVAAGLFGLAGLLLLLSRRAPQPATPASRDPSSRRPG